MEWNNMGHYTNGILDGKRTMVKDGTHQDICGRVSCIWLLIVEWVGYSWVETRRLIMQAGQNGRRWYGMV